MLAASRESLATAVERLDQVVAGADADSLRTLGDELFAVLGLLVRERVLPKEWASRSRSNPGRPWPSPLG